MIYVYDPKLGRMVEKTDQTTYAGPYISGDLPAYMSPLGTGVIEGRRARREDMARGDAREVDPSERPQGAGIVKTKEQAAAERAQIAARPAYNMTDEVRKRLLSGH